MVQTAFFALCEDKTLEDVTEPIFLKALETTSSDLQVLNLDSLSFDNAKSATENEFGI